MGRNPQIMKTEIITVDQLEKILLNYQVYDVIELNENEMLIIRDSKPLNLSKSQIDDHWNINNPVIINLFINSLVLGLRSKPLAPDYYKARGR